MVGANKNFNKQMLISRRSFPNDFIFGSSTSAYQHEGAANIGNRGPSIWDTFSQRHTGKIKDGSNGNVAVDSYHRYKEDVKIMKKIGLNAYRFSISWSRILPTGRLSGGVNQEGINYYNNLINELLANGIEPFVTLFHWDLPQELEDEYGGFLSGRIVVDFCNYAEVCFWAFGDRVKNWITLNEPWSYSVGGYVTGGLAPGRGCTKAHPIQNTLTSLCRPTFISHPLCIGDSATEPYIVSHNQLIAHAAAVQLYRENFQTTQNGKIGISLVSKWFIPYCKCSDADKKAAGRAIDFMLGWFLHPLVHGCYPSSMKDNVKERLPSFDKSELVKGSYDFIGLNYYTTYYAKDKPKPNNDKLSYTTDSHVELSGERDGVPIGPKAASTWLYIYPDGIFELLKYIKENYNDPLIYITENGVDEENNVKSTVLEDRADEIRRDYHEKHLRRVQDAYSEGVKVKGYFVWSLLDNFEWGDGYTVRFGMIHVDYKNGLTRYPKSSALWFMNFLKNQD